jgi:NAD(P)H-nitrite reductase large subunit
MYLFVLHLAYRVATLDTMYSIHVRHEQRAVVVIGTRINVQVATGINERHLLQVLRHSSSKPLRERIDTKASVRTLNGQGAL